ncbi:MAG: LysE family translocator [Bacteroidota bacterium]|nr:LysE family translocator [Bacteroidota bacterium]
MNEIWQALLFGAGYGLAMSILIGPVFFLLIQISIEKGFFPAMSFAFGIVSSDIIIFTLAWAGIAALGSGELLTEIFELAGGALLFFFGIILVIKKAEEPPTPASIHDKIEHDHRKLWIRGLAVNSLNPGAYIYWISVNTASTKIIGDSRLMFGVMLVACMGMIFGTDLLKAIAANSLQHLMTKKFMVWFNRVSGIILIVFGIIHFYKGLTMFLANYRQF